jgi:hypothetical protein
LDCIPVIEPGYAVSDIVLFGQDGLAKEALADELV